MGDKADMSAADQAFITPAVFRWAIDRARSNPEKLARKLNKTPSAVISWTEGKTRPTFAQAQKVADTLHVPFGYLFLPEPPDERLPLGDFRVAPGKRIPPSAELIDTVNDVLFKQQWYRELLLEQGAGMLPFVGVFFFAQ
jgi:transcriptional regulator with XRE-family HTH domain